MRQTKREREQRIGPVFDEGQLISKLKMVLAGTPANFKNGDPMKPVALARFLYRCDFITGRLDQGNRIKRLHFSDNQLLAEKSSNFGFKWEIHPAYRWALEPQKDDWIYNMELTTD